MKRMILAMVVGVVLAGCTPMVVPDMTPIDQAIYQEVIDINGKSQKQLFEQSKQWMALTFTSSRKVIEYEDATVGKIIGNGKSVVYFKSSGGITGTMVVPMPVVFSMTEDVKDNKARVTITNVRFTDYNGNVGGGIHSDGWVQLRPELAALCSSLKNFLQSEPEKSNW